MNTRETIDALRGNGNQVATGRVAISAASRKVAMSAAGRSGGGKQGGRA